MQQIAYEIQEYITSTDESDHEANFSVRRYGKVFYIDIVSSRFTKSPKMKEIYMTYLKVLKSGEDELDGIELADVYAWVMKPFESLFVELAPEIEVTHVTLQDWFFPDFFHFSLNMVNEERIPTRLASKYPPLMASTLRFDEDFLDDLETWTMLLDPAKITIMKGDEEDDALFKPPRKVFLQTLGLTGFFKKVYGQAAKLELENYKKIQKAQLSSTMNLCSLHGVVMDDSGFILGLVLSHIETSSLGPTLTCRINPYDLEDPPLATRRRLWNQIKTIVDGLHANDIIWSDVKPDNVLIDVHDNAWVIDFGGGYTEGWVSSDKGGTVDGDAEGMQNIRNLLLDRNVKIRGGDEMDNECS